jgi:asparagine synthase (glutamine-hydrolysing)
VSGFIGLLNRDGSPLDRTLLEDLTQSLARVAPTLRTSGCAPGWVSAMRSCERHTKRAWSASRSQRDGTGTIVADCRVDAREDLIRKLRDKGCQIDSITPDPELILHAYEVWNTACVDHLLGDFSFAIWDERRQTLFCARDQIGVKPFFYSHIGSMLAVCNDLACLRRLCPTISTRSRIADFLLHDQALDLDRNEFQGDTEAAIPRTS